MNKTLFLCLMLIPTHGAYTMLIRMPLQVIKKSLIPHRHSFRMYSTEKNQSTNPTSSTKHDDPCEDPIFFGSKIDADLYCSAQHCLPRRVKKLLSDGANVNWQNYRGKTPLIAAITSPYFNTSERSDHDFVEIITSLVNNKARVDTLALLYVNNTINKLENKRSQTMRNEHGTNLITLHTIKNILETAFKLQQNPKKNE